MKFNFNLQSYLKYIFLGLVIGTSCSIHTESKVMYKSPSIVKVTAGDSVASGLLVKQDNNDYYFVVSDHMFTSGTENICVFFGQSQYGLSALIHHRGGETVDLALIRINTDLINRNEDSDVIQEASYETGDDLYAIGFNSLGKLLIRKGKIVYILSTALEGGYDIGISAEIEKGMSGGGIFNEKGKLVAITSIHSDPLWETDLYYESGEAVGKQKSALIAKYSMGISSSRLNQYLKTQESSKGSFKSKQCI